MAIANSYPVGAVKTEDLILGTSIPLAGTNDKPVTKNFSVASVLALGSPPNVLTATVLVTDAQLRTLGTVPVEILPSVTGYIYEILGITTYPKNSGSVNDSYNWSASGNAVFYGQGFTADDHRLEIPNTYLPSGSFNINADVFAGTPIAGRYRISAALRLSTTLGVNPTVVLSPNATWTINVTYRLIQAS